MYLQQDPQSPLCTATQQMTSTVQSNPADPLGLTTTNAPFLRGAMPGVVEPPLQRQNMSHVGVMLALICVSACRVGCCWIRQAIAAQHGAPATHSERPVCRVSSSKAGILIHSCDCE